MKKADLEKLKAKRFSGGDPASARGGQGAALDKREQALARKRELLEKGRRSK
jgi:hypothetical protein